MGKNIIAPNAPDANRAAETAAAIARWNYEKSVEKVKPLVLRWKGLTIQVARELYLARKFLTSQRGQRRDPRADDYLAYSWSGYCDAINLPRQTANGWLRDFIPAELSETGEDVLLSKEELKALAPPPGQTTREQERRVARVMATGERPEGWTREEERILRERVSNQKAKKITAIWMEGKFDRKPRRDFFADVRALSKGAGRFRLKTPEHIEAQKAMFRAIHEYLEMFPSIESLMGAAVNLTDRIHGVANYLAEFLVDEESGE